MRAGCVLEASAFLEKASGLEVLRTLPEAAGIPLSGSVPWARAVYFHGDNVSRHGLRDTAPALEEED